MKNVVGPWKSGKFMPLTMRPHSLNCYAFSKLWHRCSTTDLRVGDITAINKLAKSWLYADLLEKPAELALYRHTSDGGLGLYNVQLRALANLINSYLETACKPNSRRNQFHEALLKEHVLEEPVNPSKVPPYFRGDFFPAIKRINSSPLNISKVGVKEIYRFLVEEVTMDQDRAGTPELHPLRIELAYPTNQWERTWSMARQSMIGPSLNSFLFKTLHQILPTANRLARIPPNQSSNCNRCRENDPPVSETLQHAMFDCQVSQSAGTALLQGLRHYLPEITPSRILTLILNAQKT
jgi:hypothetical protein